MDTHHVKYEVFKAADPDLCYPGSGLSLQSELWSQGREKRSCLNVREVGSGTDTAGQTVWLIVPTSQPAGPHSEGPMDALVHPAGCCSDNI